MSKSSNNNGFDVNSGYLSNLIERLMDSKANIDPISQTFYDNFLKNFSSLVGILQDSSKITQKELNKIVSYFNKSLAMDYGVKATKEFNDVIRQLKETLSERIGKDEKVDAERLAKALSNIFSTATIQSARAEQRGSKNVLLKNTSDNEKLKVLADELVKKMGLAQALDDFTSKLITFFKEDDKKKEKRQRGFVDDLVDGLEKSKFVGGALRDSFQLIGLLGGQFLSQFGNFGKILGGAFYIAMTTAGPLLISIISQGVAHGLGAVIKSSLMGIVGSGLGKVIGGALVRSLPFVIAGTVAMHAGSSIQKDADRDWNSGHKGRGALLRGSSAALKVGGGTMVAGGIAGGLGWAAGTLGATSLGVALASLGASAVAIGGTLVVMGAAIAGLVYLWKKFGKDIQAFFGRAVKFFDTEENKDKEPFSLSKWWNNIMSGDTTLAEKVSDTITGAHAAGTASKGSYNKQIVDMGYKGKGTPAQLLTNKKRGKRFDPSKMTHEEWEEADNLAPEYGSMGEILNLGKMTQRRASQVIAEDIRDKGNKSYYELVPASMARAESFNTDAKAYDLNKGTLSNAGIYAARGTSKLYSDIKAEFEKEHINTSKFKITSGIATLGREGLKYGDVPHSYSASQTGHYSSLGTTFDFGMLYQNGFKVTDKEYVRNIMRRAGYDPTYLDIEDINTSNAHIHGAFGITPEIEKRVHGVVLDNQEKQKVESEKHSLGVREKAIEQFGKDVATKIVTEEAEKGKTTEEINKILEKRLEKEKGLKLNKSGGWDSVDVTGNNNKVSFLDFGANKSFQALAFVVDGANIGFG